jgi:AraC family transcriptional activator of tynA and feaB
LLINTALSVLGDAMKRAPVLQLAAPEHVGQAACNDVLRFIEIHLSDRQAERCRVGRGLRHLAALPVAAAEAAWHAVLDADLGEAAEDGRAVAVANSKPGEASISEIAYRVGFKSAAHFSRMFKREFKVSPREYRAVGAPRPPVEPQTLVLDGGESRH